MQSMPPGSGEPERKRPASVAFSVKRSRKTRNVLGTPTRSCLPFTPANDDTDEDVQPFIDDPTYSLTTHKHKLLLDPLTQFRTLYNEGSFLASEGRYAEALSRWSQALTLVTDSLNVREVAQVHEMRAQVHLERTEWFEAVKAAETASQLCPQWAEAWQTLGRAQMAFGEPVLAAQSFEHCLCIDSSLTEVVEEELTFARDIAKRLREKGLEHAREVGGV
ncbi:uncharacterized protein SPPG_02794 [Spizellomyces punctatus DAOM BR117]|uniref:Uncharacterized protein n=1 Tax=Spizellomyces punctatus (strain DAOM BR117) TaxID=645134 RepID=A0A0L0HN18_SPIPD|nr:uncharacterized protein SPPG_02794 [Spizellomyces punctatus DAOM BR117]KND02320.1 hypothetical protein SPPG_02794 [Spizellomyces punctatus DAOM BR117]|eukprot:XP_016610359.1 hypothetical protein SPPG_02794 [Spizellomyces punctatus DAOM BR117]